MSAETVNLLKRGLAAHQMGKIADARQCYEQVLAIDPEDADANHLLGVLKTSLGQAKEGAEHIRKAVRIREPFTQARVSLGHAYTAMGDSEAAITCYKQAVDEDPKHLEALCHLAKHLQDAGRPRQAIPFYRRALEVKPSFPQVLLNLGNALLVEGEYKEALQCYLDATSQKVGYAEAYNGAGSALLALKRPGDALEAALEAVKLKPDFPEGHNNLGNAYLALDRLAEAEASFRKALSQRSGYAEAWSNLGNTLLAMNRHLEAKAAYGEALKANPQLADASYNLGLAELALGEFKTGWERYELRWRSEMRSWAREFDARLWTGNGVQPGESLLIHAEQGLGDTLQFCRYVERVRGLGLSVTLEVQPPLRRLLKHSFPDIPVVGRGSPLPGTTWRVPLLSLPKIFDTTLATLPRDVGYVKPDAESVEKWRLRLSGDGKKRVGLVWAGNPKHKNDRNRSVPVGLLREAVEGAGVSLYALQKDMPEEDELVARSWNNVGLELVDFMDTAGLVANLDLVITVDTSVAHLAGAMGKPVWNLLPYAADWRWMVGRADTPWYPSMRLFRQIQAGRWSTVMTSVSAALKDWAARPRV